MMNVFRRGTRVGIVTRTYPDIPEPAPLAYRGQVQLHTDRCDGDGACARVCPSEAITVSRTANEGWTWELDDGRCVFCGLCALACPRGAIQISNEFELAVRDPNALVTRVAFRGRPPAPRGDRDEENR